MGMKIFMSRIAVFVLVFTMIFGLTVDAAKSGSRKFKTITSVASISNITVANGTVQSAIGLPSTVNIRLSNGSIVSTSVTWSTSTPAYNPTAAGTYVFKGKIINHKNIINPNNLQASVNVIVKQSVIQEVTITSVVSLSSIAVANGTAQSAIGLPSSVNVKLSNGSIVSTSVTWGTSTPAYNPTAAGTYVFKGKITNPTNVTNPNNLQASVNVIVQLPAKQIIISSAAGIADITVANGTAQGSIGLPSTVTVNLIDANASPTSAPIAPASLTVTWSTSTPAYSSTTAGTYVFKGTIITPDNITNPNNVQASVNVIVQQAVTNTVSVKTYGAVGDGVTNDSIAIQNAANAAFSQNAALYIPSGNYYINTVISIKTSVICEGKILIKNSDDAYIKIVRNNPAGINLNESALSNLTRGSTKIGGLSNYKNGTLIFTSSPSMNGGLVLIPRQLGLSWADPYYCNEASEIVSSDGQIFPALDCTYPDPTKFRATAYEYDVPITIKGLYVESSGDTLYPSQGCMVRVWRSNVTLDNVKVVNLSSVVSKYSGISAVYCVNTTIINCRAENIHSDYGVGMGTCANTIIENLYTAKCGHGITGRHSKNCYIHGGYIDKIIDCHWGSDYVIDGATIVHEVAFAGTNITVKKLPF